MTQDTHLKEHFVKHFMEDNWAAHLRHHQRVTKSDQVFQELINGFHQPQEPPRVRHYLAQFVNRNID
ncbi:MAG: MFS transporter [Marinicellaceae bacterium]